MQRWDIFCRVVDNFGDAATCWQVARQLSNEHGIAVRLWVDHLPTLALLCPAVSPVSARQVVEAIDVRHWPPSDVPFPDLADADIPNVVIEAFACEIPESYVSAMARRAPPPVWINLEYLSAEDWVEQCHGLPSPHPRHPLTKYFFFPGFTRRTGGLLRERGFPVARATFDPAAEATFWHGLGLPPATSGEQRVSLFCYENPALPEVLNTWAAGSTHVRVFAAPDAAIRQIAAWCGESIAPEGTFHTGGLSIHALPFLPPPVYDRLLWACDVNFVRGESSFVRAQWAERPFVWQIYPQADEAHYVKLDAFLARYLTGLSEPAADAVRRCWHAWNGIGQITQAWGDFLTHRPVLERHATTWARELDRAGNLIDNLVSFALGAQKL